MKALSKYLIFSFITILVYTIAEFISGMCSGMTHDTLTTCVFAFFGTEIGACAFIRIAKKDAAEKSTDDPELNDYGWENITEGESIG